MATSEKNKIELALAAYNAGFGNVQKYGGIPIPFDPAMVDGILRYDALRPSTQRAWLAAGAAVARGL